MSLYPLSIALVFMGLALVPGCATKNRSPDRAIAKAPEVLGTHYTALVFGRGETTLSEMNKRHLNNLAQRALRDGREIKDIKILAWADKEYPESVKKAAREDIVLAKKRARSIKDYFEDDLHSHENMASYNMAKKPNVAARIFKNDDWAVKEAFEKSGVTTTKLADGSMSYTKASKALIIIDYEENNNQ